MAHQLTQYILISLQRHFFFVQVIFEKKNYFKQKHLCFWSI